VEMGPTTFAVICEALTLRTVLTQG
jgi:hypothetical protein